MLRSVTGTFGESALPRSGCAFEAAGLFDAML